MIKQRTLLDILYKPCSILFRIILGLAIPALILGQFYSGAAGHNRNFSVSDKLFFAYLIATITLLTYYHNSEKKHLLIGKVIFYAISALVFVSMVYELYALYDTFFICNCFTTGDNIISILIFIFFLISTIVFVGLILERIKINR